MRRKVHIHDNEERQIKVLREEHQAEACAVTDEPTAKCGQEESARHREEAHLETFPTTSGGGPQKVTGDL